MIKAIMFDLDGVISDTDRTRFDLLKILLEKRGLVLNESDYKKSVGRRTEIFLKDLFGDKLTDDEIKNIYIERKEEYRNNPAKYVLSQPHAFECCQKLFEAGFILAIASAAQEKDIKIVLNELNILQFFKTVVGSDLIKNMKPHPETYLRCMEKLQLSTDECIAIEDSPTGVKSAKDAGVICVAVTYTHTEDELSEADRLITSLSQLTPELVSGVKN
ncbi:MAG: HAD family phosphatase [Leadbetterella sp.]|nr:HAD family phosphatase [Leadbetterella sp.]